MASTPSLLCSFLIKSVINLWVLIEILEQRVALIIAMGLPDSALPDDRSDGRYNPLSRFTSVGTHWHTRTDYFSTDQISLYPRVLEPHQGQPESRHHLIKDEHNASASYISAAPPKTLGRQDTSCASYSSTIIAATSP